MADLLKGGTPSGRLDEYGSTRLAEWRSLLGVDGSLMPGGKTDSWVSGVSERLLPCMPASGDDLAQLLAQLHLEMPQTNQTEVASH